MLFLKCIYDDDYLNFIVWKYWCYIRCYVVYEDVSCFYVVCGINIIIFLELLEYCSVERIVNGSIV